MLDRRRISHVDWATFGLAMILVAVGFLNLISALSPSYSLLKKQVFVFLLGLLALPVVTLYDYRKLAEISLWIYVVVLCLIVLTFLFGVRAGGARRWLNLFGMNLQPSEFMKLSIILLLSQRLHEKRALGVKLGPRDLGVPLLLILLPTALVLLQPDLGTAVILLLVSLSILWYAGLKPSVYVALGLLGGASPYLLWEYLLRPYQKARILIHLNLLSDPQGLGYHTTQAKIAVGSGKFFGKGFMEGTQHRLQFVPEHHTDFIFTVFAEEWGFVGCIVLLFLFLLFVYRCIRISESASDELGSIIAFGIASLVYFQLTMNLFMALNILPAVGVPLPFMSYGGSALLTILLCLGLLMNIQVRRYMF
jgi:rod shape determining protein RodA